LTVIKTASNTAYTATLLLPRRSAHPPPNTEYVEKGSFLFFVYSSDDFYAVKLDINQ